MKVSLHTAQASRTPLWWDAPQQSSCRDFTIYPLGAATLIVLLEGAPAKTRRPAIICFPSSRQFAKLSRDESTWATQGVARSLHPFGLGISTSWWPYPPHYRTAFAFSVILYPLRLPLSLRSGYHSPVGGGAHRAYDGCFSSALTAVEMRSG